VQSMHSIRLGRSQENEISLRTWQELWVVHSRTPSTFFEVFNFCVSSVATVYVAPPQVVPYPRASFRVCRYKLPLRDGLYRELHDCRRCPVSVA